MDDADITQERTEREAALRARKTPFEIPPGVDGDCDLCGEYCRRLVGGVCAPCRDKHHLP